jgi:GGDEF domain-containing protein
MLSTVYLPAVAQGLHLHASFGVATYPEDAVDITAMLAKADQAMFDIKVKGKNAIGDASGPVSG